MRTALAMGADRAILVETSAELQPLAVAKLLEGDRRARSSRASSSWASRRSTTTATRPAQMLAALLGWPQATFVSKLELEGGKAKVSREVDEGLEQLEVKLPAVVTVDLRLNEPRYASLPNIMKAKKKPIDVLKPEELGVDVAPRLQYLKFEEPAKRAGRRQGRLGRRAGRQAEERGGGALMAVLVLAQHDNADARRRRRCTRVTAAAAARRATSICWSPARTAAPSPRPPPRSPACARSCASRRRPTRSPLAEELGGTDLALAERLRLSARAPSTTTGKNVHAARRGAARRRPRSSDIVEVLGPDTFKRSIYAGNALATVESTDASG